MNGKGIVQTVAYPHFQLWNCGTDVPQVIGKSLAQYFDTSNRTLPQGIWLLSNAAPAD
jgi:hypothetical protein